MGENVEERLDPEVVVTLSGASVVLLAVVKEIIDKEAVMIFIEAVAFW